MSNASRKHNANSDEYNPPSSSYMSQSQNTVDALRLLLAQRRLYSRSKRWLLLRTTGMLIIAIVAPVTSLLWPDLAVLAGAIAGVWMFLGRTVLIHLEKQTSARAAAVQEMFDSQLYGMPSFGSRTPMPSLEEIAAIAGNDVRIHEAAAADNLFDWYEIDGKQSGLVTVALCQRSNAAYAESLLKTHSTLWVTILAGWAVLLFAAGIVIDLSSSDLLLGIVAPLLPAFLDAVRYWFGIRRAAADRRDLRIAIESKLQDSARELDSHDLVAWQDRLYHLRRDVPQVPDLVYRIRRKKNEAAMKSAVSQLSSKVSKDSTEEI